MALTPVEIRHLTPPRTLFRGYSTEATDDLLQDIVASFEDVWRERADLRDKVEQLEADLVRFRELETLLRTTLVSAEQASAQMKEQARREAELILNEANAEARQTQRRAIAENDINEAYRTKSKALRSEKLDEIKLFHQALRTYRKQDWDKADMELLSLQNMYPDCKLYRVYAERVTYYRNNPPGEDWDGVFVFKTK